MKKTLVAIFSIMLLFSCKKKNEPEANKVCTCTYQAGLGNYQTRQYSFPASTAASECAKKHAAFSKPSYISGGCTLK